MARQTLLPLVFLLFLNISLVLCRDDYYHYYNNLYWKSTPHDGVHSTEATVPLAAGYSSYDSYSYNRSEVIIRIIIAVGCVASFLIAVCVILCCRPACCRGKRTPGYVISDNAARIMTQQHGPLLSAQQLPNDSPGHSLPPVQQQQFQTAQVQQHLYSPAQEQYHNPPVAPPPYSEKY